MYFNYTKELQTSTSTLERLDSPCAPIIKRWPTKPNTLTRQSLLLEVFYSFIYIIGALSPVAFLILAYEAYKLDDKATSSWGDSVIRVTYLGTSIYPILFSMVLGQAMKSIARWRAEKGSTFRTLELLMGSQTLGSTIVTQISTLGTTTPVVLGFGLVVLWLLSPLGGQASLNLLSRYGHKSYESTYVRYLNSELQMSSLGAPFTPKFIYGALYTSSLISPLSTQHASMDIWGNVKIPMIESLKSSGSDIDGWVPVSTNENVSYSSLIGTPVVGIPHQGFANFSLESSYFVLDCSSPLHVQRNDSRLQGRLGQLWENLDAALPYSPFLMDSITPLERNLTSDMAPRNIFFASTASISEDSDGYSEAVSLTIANCSVTRSYVEARVECERKDCRSTHIRKSKKNHPPAAYTPLDTRSQSYGHFATLFTTQGLFSDGQTRRPIFFSTTTERFMNDPSNPVSASNATSKPNGRRVVDLSKLSKELFTSRLSLAFNTFWMASLAPQYIPGNIQLDPEDLTVRTKAPNFGEGQRDDNWDMPLEESFAASESNITVVITEERYTCNRVWLWTLVCTTLTLLIFAIIGAILRSLCLGPDILGYVSSLAMDNPYIVLPPGGCTLDGPERSKLVADVRVKLLDVSKADIGHIALSSLSGPHGTRELKKGRPYMGSQMSL